MKLTPEDREALVKLGYSVTDRYCIWRAWGRGEPTGDRELNMKTNHFEPTYHSVAMGPWRPAPDQAWNDVYADYVARRMAT